MQLRKLSQLVCLLTLVLLPARDALALATLNLGALPLKTAGGSLMSLNGLVILVASTNGTTFGGPTASSFVSSGNIEVARWNLSGSGSPGELGDTTGPISVTGSVASGQALALYWFPTLTTAASVPGGGVSYGYYRDPVANGVYGSGVDGGDPWFVPADGATITLLMVTTEAGGSVNPTNSPASRVVPGGNNNPVAVDDSFARTSSLSIKIDKAALIANDTDSDGGTISLTGVNLTTTNGVTLTTNATDVLYPASAANVNDKFTYTISDGQGGAATGSVYITIINVTGTNSVISLQTSVPSSGQATLKFAGVPGFSYVSQYATNVNGPWVNFATNVAANNGLWTNIDVNATNASRFYRAKY
ncbi:MAG: hypothetical protein RLZZ350_1368 [Verrucomicrobiota bacterium]|jgi:hypothetical protein